MTFRLGGGCSIQLSYQGRLGIISGKPVEIPSQALQAVLKLPNRAPTIYLDIPTFGPCFEPYHGLRTDLGDAGFTQVQDLPDLA